MELNNKLIWVYIGIGVIANVITGVLLLPLFRMLWARMNRPTPLRLRDRVQLADQLEMQKRYMERLNHLAANPKDLYLYFFQLGLAVFLCFSAAECLLVWGVKEVIPAVLALLILSFTVSVVAFVEAKRLSAKNIERTKATIQKSIDEATSKLNLP
jgi:hypothetical protein